MKLGHSGEPRLGGLAQRILRLENAMPLVTIHMYEGRTIEQKRELVAAVTEVVARIAKTTPESTEVIINDVARENWSKAGKLASDQ